MHQMLGIKVFKKNTGLGSQNLPLAFHGLGDISMETWNQWEFQDPDMEVPTIYKAYIRPM